jgi:hypothetical protein
MKSEITCPVAELERQILAAMDSHDADETRLQDCPDEPSRKLLDDKVRDASDLIVALRELTTHTLATSVAGLRYQTEELSTAQDGLGDGDENRRKVARLVALIGKTARKLSPSAYDAAPDA